MAPGLDSESKSAARRQLFREVKECIAPYRDSLQRPPITMAELVVISLLSTSRGKWQDSIGWIFNHFQYYREIAIHFYIKNCWGRTGSSDRFRDLVLEAFQQSNAPIKEVFGEMVPVSEGTYTTKPNEARAFLQAMFSRLSTTDIPGKPFPFLKLPVELRVRVYELVLGLPKSGVRIAKGNEMQTWTRDYEKPANMLDWAKLRKTTDHTLKGPPLGKLLALFRVSKQVFAEAMPVFYNVNTFVFKGTTELDVFLEETREDRRQYIRHLMFDYHNKVSWGCRWQGFEKLVDMKGLRKLDISVGTPVGSADLAKMPSGQITAMRPHFPRMRGLPPFEDIPGLRSVTFHGECDEIRKSIRDEIVRAAIEEAEKAAAQQARKLRREAKREAKRKARAEPAADRQEAKGLNWKRR